MRRFLCLFLMICCFSLTGCFNYRDLDKVLFATSVIVDVDNNGNPIIYVEAFKPERTLQATAGSSQRILFRGSRKTIFETLRDIDMSSSYKLNYTQTRAIIFTEKAAEKSMCDFIDIFGRDQEFVIRSYIAVLKGNPEKFINTFLKEQEYIGVFINDLIHNVPASSRAVITTLNDFLNSIYTAEHTSVLTMLELKSDQPESKIELSNGAIIKDCKMIDNLKTQDGLGYNFLIDNINGGSLEITNPDSYSKYVSLEILKAKTKTKIYYEDGEINLKKIINVKTSIAETEDKININNKTINKLQQEAEKNIKDSCNNVFEKYKFKNIDIFQIHENFERKYPRIKVKNPIKHTHLDLDVNVDIEGSSTKSNFR